MDNLVIGIDLGTTNSCVSLYLNGKTRILDNSDGGRITPSFIFFTSLQEILVGEHAKRMAKGRPDHGIYEVKRLVGRKFEDTYIQNNLQYLPFKVESDSEGDPIVIVEQRTKTFRKTPQELCTIILEKLKTDAEAKLGEKINKVVITVPAYFNVTQREITLKSARAAGFTVLKLLNEPTAAALSYYIENDCDHDNFSLVYDLGGGTFDVAILKKRKDRIDVLGVGGDTQLGGHDFDNLIVNYVCEELTKKYNYDPRNDKNTLRRLHNKCEDAKRALSTAQKTIITLIGFVKEHPNVQIELTREQFETVADELFKKTIAIVDSCLKSCGFTKNSINEIILSGGSTRIPKIQQMISDYFRGKKLNKFVNPDECVAEGAALQAAMLSNNSKQYVQKIRLVDVVPLSLGTDSLCGRMNFMITKNTMIPTSASTNYVTLYDKETSMSLNIYEGERRNVNNNRLIGKFTIKNLTPAPPGQCQVKLTMSLDENGILTVRAKELSKNNVQEVSIIYTRGTQNEIEIKNTLLDAENNKKEDERFLEFAKFKAFLIRYCIAIKYNMDEKDLAVKHRHVYELCQQTLNSGEVMGVDQEDQIKELIEEIKVQCEPLVRHYTFSLMPTLKQI